MTLNKFEKTALKILNVLSEARPDGTNWIDLKDKVKEDNLKKVYTELESKDFVIGPGVKTPLDMYFHIKGNGLIYREELSRKQREERQLKFNKILALATSILGIGVVFDVIFNMMDHDSVISGYDMLLIYGFIILLIVLLNFAFVSLIKTTWKTWWE